MFKNVTICCAAALILMMTACKSQSPGTNQEGGTTSPASMPPVSSTPPPAVNVKEGKVAETMDSGNYTYILVDDGSEQSWIAMLKTSVNVGEEISYYDGMVMQNFVSKTLDRTFEKIIFSNGLVGDKAEFTAPPPAVATGQSAADSFAEALNNEIPDTAAQTQAPGSRKAVVPFAEVKVEKATGENSFTIGELYEKANELDGKMVRVKGKIMKVSRQIMGMNWIHIQDGTGDANSNTHDLVVTTTLEPQDDWDVITANGTLSANKDFGAGYRYAVIVEGATFDE